MKFNKPSSTSILGLDIGEKRIGLAYSDALNITVNILPAVKRTKDFSELKIIQEHIYKHNIHGIIAGLPLDEKGCMTKQAIDCKTYVDIVIKKIELPFAFVNEHSSTWEALNRFDIKKDKTGLIDSFSAKIILEQWIIEGPELEEYVLSGHEKY